MAESVSCSRLPVLKRMNQKGQNVQNATKRPNINFRAHLSLQIQVHHFRCTVPAPFDQSDNKISLRAHERVSNY